MNRAGDVRDGGSVALEFTLVAPVLLLLVALLLACARATQVSATLDSGVRDAARAATTARDPAPRSSAPPRSCAAPWAWGTAPDSLVVDPIAEFAPGRPVTITATCRYSVADLGLPGLPGTLSVTSSFASPLDPNRELS